MSICKVATEKETMLIESNAVAYAEASKAAIESFIGFRESYSGKDLKMYNKTHDLFYNFFDRNALIIHATTVPQAFIDNIKKYSLKSTSNLGVMNPDTVNYSANAMVGIYNRTKKILTRIEKNKGNVGKFAGMLRDPFMVGLLADSGGVMNKLIDHVQAFGDRRDQRFLTQVNNIGDAKEIFKSKLEDIFSQKFDDDRINDYIADGLDGFVTHNGDKVTILKVSETMRGNGEDTQLTVRYNTGIKKRKTETIGVTFAPEHRFTDRWRKNKPSRVGVLMKKNVAEQLKNALKNKYSNTITSEIKNGQIRYIEAGSNPSKEDLAVITRMLKEESIRYDNKDTKKFGYFHKIERNGWTIEYVMVKQPEGKEGKEVYKAYITSKVLTAKIDEKDSGKYYFYNRHIKSKAKNDYDYVQSRDFSGHKSLKELGILEDGYYRSNEQDEFGTAINNQYSLINGSVNKQWVGFNKINSKTFSDIVSMPSFWDAIRIYRNEMKTVPDIVRNSYRDNVIRNQKTKKYLDSVVDKSGKIKELITKLGADNLNAYTLYDLKENYFPNMPDRENRQKMLMAEVNTLQKKLELETNEILIEYYRNAIDELLGNTNKDNYEDENIILHKIGFTKHRSTALYGQNIRKDDGVERDYFHFTSHMIEKNNTKSLIAESIANIIRNNGNKIEGVETQIDYLMKKSRQAFGDTDIELPFPFISNGDVARMATKFVNMFDKNYKMSPNDAAKIIKKIKTLISAVTLGSRGAKQNRWQPSNAVIPFGAYFYKEARRALDTNRGEPNKWRDRLLYYGTGNVTAQLNDQIFLGGESSPMDVGFLEAGRAKIPTKNMKEWADLHKMGRKAFIEQETFLDKFFPPLAERRLKRYLKTFTSLEQKAKNEKVKNEIRYLKKVYWEMFFADEKSNTPENQKRLFKELLSETSDEKLRSILNFKLTWHVTSAHKETLTFTGTEDAGRDEVAVMAVLVADSMGALGVDTEDKNGNVIDGSRFKTKTATNIARNTVYQYMFGISKVYLPLMFEGAGALGFQFKNYPMHQEMVNARNMKNFWDTTPGGVNTKVTNMLKRAIKEGINIEQLWNPNFKDNRIDHDALMFMRGTYLHGFATLLSIWNEFVNIPILRNTLQTPVGGLESPILSMFGRVLGRALLLVTYAGVFKDDDDDENANAILDNLLFLLIPAFISVSAFSIMKILETMGDVTENWMDES